MRSVPFGYRQLDVSECPDVYYPALRLQLAGNPAVAPRPMDHRVLEGKLDTGADMTLVNPDALNQVQAVQAADLVTVDWPGVQGHGCASLRGPSSRPVTERVYTGVYLILELGGAANHMEIGPLAVVASKHIPVDEAWIGCDVLADVFVILDGPRRTLLFPTMAEAERIRASETNGDSPSPP